jgi:hypothetical protein
MSEVPGRAEAHLHRYADLDRFWIYRTPDTQPGVINYADSFGQAWTLMEDDDEFVEQCLNLLESRGCPVFDDVSKMQAHAERLAVQVQQQGSGNTMPDSGR